MWRIYMCFTLSDECGEYTCVLLWHMNVADKRVLPCKMNVADMLVFYHVGCWMNSADMHAYVCGGYTCVFLCKMNMADIHVFTM